MRKLGNLGWLAAAIFCLWVPFVLSQQAQDPSKQQVPDAPSTAQPPKTFPSVPQTAPPSGPPPQEQAPADAPKPDQGQDQGTGEGTDQATEPAPPFNVKTVPPAEGAPAEADQGVYKLPPVSVNQVLVPVMVKDNGGRLMSGLLPKDFTVYEDNVKQKMNFFTSDPFPLSAAVIFDLGMPDSAVQKVNQTFSALEGAFSPFDQISIFTYSGTVSKVSDFTTVGKKLTATLNSLKTTTGRNNGPAITGGPLGSSGPVINNYPVQPSAPTVVTPPREAHALNDAVLAAAMELSKQDRARRKIIFIISDGREYGSRASYSDVLKVLLSRGIMVYGIGAESAAIPGYNKLQKLHLPRFGYSDILPKYASATGGEIFTEFSRDAIESTYARAIGDARNQYTLGYIAKTTPSSAYRSIEVRVARQDVKVYARDGYYPLPAGR